MRYPEKLALVFMGQTWTYAQLLKAAEQIASALRKMGVQKGDRVVLDMQNCPQLVMAHFAILRLDAVVVPVNPMNRMEELKHYILDPDAKVAVTTADLALIVVGIFELAGQSLGPNPIREILHVTGKTSLNLLLITLCATPLRELTGQTWWVRPRRLLGLMAFSYALLHFLVYAVLELELQLGELGQELARRPYILVGAG
jgi:non-ribosomal peptide synthetase component E (peptide arylation enzyme)